jgi:thioredoxin-related protein
MKSDIQRKLELAANVAIIITASLLCLVLVKSYLISQPPPTTNSVASNNINQVQAGTELSIPGIDWAKNKRTLLLALSTTCHFCTESGPFYQRLVKGHGATQLIAVMPQAVEEGRQYLKKLGVEINEVKQVSMSTLGLSGTPTLVLVDNNGKVANVWVGALSPNMENEVLSQLQSERASK